MPTYKLTPVMKQYDRIFQELSKVFLLFLFPHFKEISKCFCSDGNSHMALAPTNSMLSLENTQKQTLISVL